MRKQTQTPMPERVAPKASTARGRGKATHVEERGRTTRAQEDENEIFTRVPEDKHWERPASLEAPQARSGFGQRWIRVGYQDKIDEKNLQQKLREGWRARHIDTIPKSFHVPRIKHGRFAGAVMVEGMMLAEIPIRILNERRKAMRAKIDGQTRAIDEQIRQANAGSQRGGFGPIKRAQESKVVREVDKDFGKAEEAAEEEVL